MSAPNNSPTTAKAESSAVKAVESVLGDHPFLDGLKAQHRRLLADSAMRMHYNAGELIFREDDPAKEWRNRGKSIASAEEKVLEKWMPEELMSMAKRNMGKQQS